MMCLTQGGSGDSLLDPGFADAQEFRRVLAPWLEGCAFEEAAHGESAARVLRVLRPGRAPAYLKYATGRDARSIVDEHERIQWLESRVAVPKVIAFHSTSHAAWLLTEALVGRNAADAATEAPRFVVAGMAHALRGLHATPAGDCPFDAALHLRLAAARERMEAGLVDEEDFDEARQGMHAQEVFASLMARNASSPMATHVRRISSSPGTPSSVSWTAAGQALPTAIRTWRLPPETSSRSLASSLPNSSSPSTESLSRTNAVSSSIGCWMSFSEALACRKTRIFQNAQEAPCNPEAAIAASSSSAWTP
jgi:hypothetical protein